MLAYGVALIEIPHFVMERKMLLGISSAPRRLGSSQRETSERTAAAISAGPGSVSSSSSFW